MQIDHPDFYWFHERGAHGLPIIVFKRDVFNDPSPEELVIYFKNAEMVKSLGGTMIRQAYEIGGMTPVFTQREVYEMIKAVRKAIPVTRYIYDYWNGVGCRTFSVCIN